MLYLECVKYEESELCNLCSRNRLATSDGGTEIKLLVADIEWVI